MKDEGLPSLGLPVDPALPVRVGMRLHEAEALLIAATLRHTGWNVKAAGHILGIDRSTVYAKIKQYGLVRQMAGETLGDDSESSVASATERIDHV